MAGIILSIMISFANSTLQNKNYFPKILAYIKFFTYLRIVFKGRVRRIHNFYTNMNLEQIVKKMSECQWALRMGKGKLAKKWHCSEEDIVKAREIVKKKIESGEIYRQHRGNKCEHKAPFLKVLIFDIETAPMKAYVWHRWKEIVSLDQTISEWFTICWSAKWLYADEVMSDCLTPEEILKEDDHRIVESLWKLFDEADIVVAHNACGFDVPKMNSRFLVNGLMPPSSYYTVDTLAIAKKTFGFSSNKLDALAGYFDIPHKLETNFELWKDCLEGNQQALDYMEQYNKRDVEILESVYLKLRPFIKGHPNISNLTEKDCCCSCGSEALEPIPNKFYYTSVSKFQLYRCKDCGAVVRGRKNLAEKVKFVSPCR